MAILTVTPENFDALVLHAPDTVLLDFWATWCGPCRMIAPILEQIAQEDASITIGKVNVDESSALAARFGIVSIPTLIVFQDGKELTRAVGYRPKEDILALLP